MDPSKLCFLDLPAEIRNEIYSNALVEDNPIPQPEGITKSPDKTTSLLLISKIIAAEASSIFYGKNCFTTSLPTFDDDERIAKLITKSPDKVACFPVDNTTARELTPTSFSTDDPSTEEDEDNLNSTENSSPPEEAKNNLISPEASSTTEEDKYQLISMEEERINFSTSALEPDGGDDLLSSSANETTILIPALIPVKRGDLTSFDADKLVISPTTCDNEESGIRRIIKEMHSCVKFCRGTNGLHILTKIQNLQVQLFYSDVCASEGDEGRACLQDMWINALCNRYRHGGGLIKNLETRIPLL